MIQKLIALLGGSSAAAQARPTFEPPDPSSLGELARQINADPLIGATLGSKEVNRRLMDAMTDERGIHIDSLLCALGSLAGYSCQAALRAQALAAGSPEDGLLVRVRTRDGRSFYFGDHLNRSLAESPDSVWSIAGSGARQVGCGALPDLAEIFQHASATVGTPAFGLPRVPAANRAQDTPLNYVRALWPAFLPLVKHFSPNPAHWHVLYALSIQEVIALGKSRLDPCTALRLAMEAAVPMSKIDLGAA